MLGAAVVWAGISVAGAGVDGPQAIRVRTVARVKNKIMLVDARVRGLFCGISVFQQRILLVRMVYIIIGPLVCKCTQYGNARIRVTSP